MPHNNPHPHQQLLGARLPAWASVLARVHWQALGDSLLPAQGLPGEQADWFANAHPQQRETLLASQARLDTARYRLARELKGLKQITEFAEPLLADRLKRDHRFEAPLRTSELIWLHHRFTHQVYVTTHERYSLLEAALHNFADDVSFSTDSALALQGDTTVHEVTVSGRTTLGDSDTEVEIVLESQRLEIKPLALSPADFAATCRDLNLGRQYQDHLDSQFASSKVRPAAIALYKASLRASADLAHLRHRISGAAVDAIGQLLDGRSTYQCQQLELFGVVLHEAMLIDAGDAGLLLYLPAHEASMRSFSDIDALHAQLCEDLAAPLSRNPFCAYLPKAQQTAFLDRARQNLSIASTSGYDQAWTLPAGADLHLKRIAITAPIFEFLFDDHLDRLKAETQLLAIPTEEADERARKRRQAEWERLGMTALMAASFVIPAAGVAMLAVTACQLLDETYEGYQAWSIGDRHEALGHLKTVGLNLAIIAGLGAAGAVASRLSSTPLMESLTPVELADGSQRLYKPDLSVYASPFELPEGLEANARGQFIVQGRHFIRFDGQLFEQRLDPGLQRWRIVHPEKPDAYQPLLEDNGDGAWRAEHEQPQTWDKQQLVRRLGPAFATADDSDLALAMDITGIDAAALRQVHLQGLPTPPLLEDTMVRMSISRQVMGNLAGRPAQEVRQAIQIRYAHTVTDTESMRLVQRYPSLSSPLARRLLGMLKNSERSQWQMRDTLPTRIVQAIQTVLLELPLARGLEGLHMPILAEEHTERLLFASLTRLREWPATLGVSLRAGSPSGLLLRECGLPLAPRITRLIKSASGYEADLGERPAPGPVSIDLLETLVRGLPGDLREAVAGKGVQDLRERLQTQISQMRGALTERLHAPEMAGWRSRGRLLGGLDPSPQQPAELLRTSFETRLQRLFPLSTQADAQRMLQEWRRNLRNPEIEIARLEARRRELRADLQLWAQDSPARQVAMQRIIATQRGNSIITLADGTVQHGLDLSHLALDDESLATLALPDDFRHVTELDLSGNPRVSQLPAEFHERFPALERLHLGGCGFTTLPQLARPEALAWLDIDRNPLTWNTNLQATLDRYVNLRVLDMSHCPLTQAPSLSLHSNIRTLYMDNCLLPTLPVGLQNLIDPLLLDFSHNPLVALPPGVALPGQVARTLRLESELLSPVVRDQITAYYEATGIDLLIPEVDYDELLVDADDVMYAVWSRLPLTFRRDLRNLLESDRYLDGLPHSRAETWRRLVRADQDIYYRRRMLAQPAVYLLDRPIEQI
ncbi:TPA: leucine-rich repeat domain-containing protein [Pseudomonas putida]|nr:leucine-rich repeat domain-containing protein [Pseudomonas putida]